MGFWKGFWKEYVLHSHFSGTELLNITNILTKENVGDNTLESEDFDGEDPSIIKAKLKADLEGFKTTYWAVTAVTFAFALLLFLIQQAIKTNMAGFGIAILITLISLTVILLILYSINVHQVRKRVFILELLEIKVKKKT